MQWLFSGLRQKIVPPPASLTAEMHERKASAEVELQLVKSFFVPRASFRRSMYLFFFFLDFTDSTYQYD